MAKTAPKPSTREAGEAGAPTPRTTSLSGWQQRALDRSLVEAKRRALNKSNGFVEAAMELLDETGGLNFTVQDVVDRSKLSLRSFYQTFASKDDLLLALFEECVASAAEWQRGRMAKHDDPIEQIRGVPHQPLERPAEPRGRPRPRALQPDPVGDPAERPRARAGAAARACCSRRSSAASRRGRCATTSTAAGSPRSSCTPATPRCTPRSCRPAASRPTTSGRSASGASAPG